MDYRAAREAMFPSLPIQNQYGQFQVGGPLKGKEGALDTLYEMAPGIGDYRALMRALEAGRPQVQPNLSGGANVSIDQNRALMEALTAAPGVGDAATAMKGMMLGGPMLLSVLKGKARNQAGKIGAAADLPMDEASRMARAREMGDTGQTFYHGGGSDISEVTASPEKPFFVSPTPDLANQFAGNHTPRAAAQGGNVMPIRLLTENTFDINNPAHLNDLEAIAKDRVLADKIGGVKEGLFNMTEDPEVLRALKDKGYDSFYIRELPEKEVYRNADRSFLLFDSVGDAEAFYKQQLDKWSRVDGALSRTRPKVTKENGKFRVAFQGEEFTQTTKPGNFHRNIGIIDTGKIRSNFAKFDPRDKNSANILAGGAAGAIGLGAALEQYKSE